MFSLFGKKDSVIISDTVYLTGTAKWKACLAAVTNNSLIIFIAWFPESQQQLQQYFSQHSTLQPTVLLYRNANSFNTKDKKIIFVEHYPLPQKENELYISLALKEVQVYSSLDEPLFTCFGGERLTAILNNLGMKEDEPLQHALITKSLHNAQERIAEKVTLEQNALSQAEWFSRNFPNTA